MVESDGWFRLRWFLTGSLGAVLTAHALRYSARAHPPALAPEPSPVVAVPVAVPRSAPSPEPEMLEPVAVEPVAVEPVAAEPAEPARRTPKRTRTRDPGPRPDVAAKPAEAPAPTAPVKPAREVDDATTAEARRALRALLAKPEDGLRRARLESALERAASKLGSAEQQTIRRCITHAGFEGRAAVAAEALRQCVQRLEELRR